MRARRAHGAPFEEIDARAALESEVCAPFEAAYLAGATPSPCVLCNRRVKLKLLCEAADALGIERIATGHYAAARAGAIFRGRPENDQSYMLCLITREEARRLVLPLGGYIKRDVRAMAAQFGLMQAEKPDSMEICFIKDGDFAAWIERRGRAPGEGALIYKGRRVGTHGGMPPLHARAAARARFCRRAPSFRERDTPGNERGRPLRRRRAIYDAHTHRRGQLAHYAAGGGLPLPGARAPLPLARCRNRPGHAGRYAGHQFSTPPCARPAPARPQRSTAQAACSWAEG